ncbi:hydratase [Allofournierella sp.]|uniref:hydratase n=1 Tax=Allofournierella sp. TaxID=1940256 RepID=UPI002E75B2F2|nr:hydratase [Fournierella sp.]MEE0755774.1 hydratase [Fournierella sp.]
MVTCSKTGMYYARGQWVPADENAPAALAALGFDEAARQNARKGTIAWGILQAHNHSGDENALKLKFDAMASHDITFVGIVQTARASGLTKFPMPYVLTNCHNSLCAVGGTINEDDHLFGLSAAKKYGGVYVPPHLAVIHQYMREMYAGCGKMILGSDSHTRYGALGTMAIGEGGGELAKQLLNRTYDVACPGVVAVHLTGAPVPGVGPQDVALAIIGAVFANGYVKNKVMEFVGPGVASLPLEYRSGIDVMTTETTCLSSIWVTDEATRKYLAVHGREGDYKPLAPADLAYYDGVVEVALDKVRPMIALPMHPSNVYTIEELNANLADILHKTEEDCAALVGGKVKLDLVSKIENGRLRVDQGVIAGCAGGTYSNICEAAQILEGHTGGNGEYALSVYPSSQPTMMALMKNGALASLMAGGATVRTAFCGPCFGAGDVPANGSLSIRHTTRNFPSREGSKPGSGQIAGVALMDARSIAATTRMGGILTPATDIDYEPHISEYEFDDSSYKSRVYNGWGKGDYDSLLRLGPNIKDWPAIQPLADNLLLKVTSYITDPVTTTDELIPSGETSSYRSNPLGLAEFTLSRKDPAYVGRAKAVQAEEADRAAGKGSDELLAKVRAVPGCEDLTWNDLAIASTIYAVKPGDGSAREQAASCQRVLGAGANIAVEYATKRYRSNLINWGMLPFQLDGPTPFGLGDYILIPGARALLAEDKLESIPAYVLGENGPKAFSLSIAPLTADERQILLDGCLINYYKHG